MVRGAASALFILLLYLAWEPSDTAKSEPVTVFIAGDVLLGRGVTPALSRGSTTLDTHCGQISKADLAFCNLECAVSPTRKSSARAQLLAKPTSIRFLQAAGFDIVSLANNHALDAGEAGLQTTLYCLRKAHIVGIGAQGGDHLWQAWRRDVRGRRVAWVAASAYGPFQKGRARVRPLAGSGLIEQVRSLAQQGETVFVSLHWGVEHDRTPTRGQRQTARALIDAGASAIIGHHPHVAQPIEIYQGRPIFYSLGNFLFDRMPRQQDGIAALITVDEQGDVTFRTFSVVPSIVDDTPPLPRGEKVVKLIRGRFVPKNTRAQAVVWSQRSDGMSVLRAYVRETDRWRPVAEGYPPGIYDLQAGDVDDDGRDDVLIGLHGRSKLDVTVRSRLHLYQVDDRRGFLPKWRGSGLSRPFRHFRLLSRGKSCDLVAVEVSSDKRYQEFNWIAVYRWNGFGFCLLWDTPVLGNASDLCTGSDERGSYIRFIQKSRQHHRTLILRPIRNEEEGVIRYKASICNE